MARYMLNITVYALIMPKKTHKKLLTFTHTKTWPYGKKKLDILPGKYFFLYMDWVEKLGEKININLVI